MNLLNSQLNHHKVVSQDEWNKAHAAHLAEEKRVTHMHDALSQKRRELPWVKVEKNYVFDGIDGKQTLSELFDGNSQLVIKHFMLGPDWKEGCVGCSFECDHLDATLVHLHNHDVTVVAVSRAPLAKIEPFHKRMGWAFKWVSSAGSDFNFDYHVSFTPDEVARGKGYYNYAERDIPADELSGFSVFYKDDAGDVFHTFSSFGRGAEELLGTYVVLDMTPKGRNENGPQRNLTDWVRHHDRYGSGGRVDNAGRFVAATADACGSSCGCGAKEQS